MEKAANTRQKQRAAGLVLRPAQVGMLVGFVALGLVAAFGVGVLVGMWYQASDTIGLSAGLPAADQPARLSEEEAEESTPVMTFYSALTAKQPPESSQAAPPTTARQAPREAQARQQAKVALSRVEVARRAVRRRRPAVQYSIQVGSFRARDEAEKLKQRLTGKGYPARVKLVHVPGKGLWYRVRVGQFAERMAAERLAQRLTTRERLQALVIGITP